MRGRPWRIQVTDCVTEREAVMADQVFEVTITARDAANREHTVHGEYVAQGETPDAAASEVWDACVKEHGKERARGVDPSR